MRKIAFVALLSFVGLLFFAKAPMASAQSEKETEKPKQQHKTATVQSGDSLTKIAKRYKTKYTRIYYANTKIKHPDLIYPGDKLKIPNKDEKLKKRPLGTSKRGVTNSNGFPKQTNEPTPQQPVYRSQSQPASAKVSSAGGSAWDRLAACESGGNWQINTGNGYYGGLQFSLSSWRGVGGQGYPHQASKAEQIRRGEMLRASGGWGHWPACSAKLGLR